MKNAFLKNRVYLLATTCLLMAGSIFAQTNGTSVRRNSPFAPNPKGRVEVAKASNSELQGKSGVQKTINIEPTTAKAETAAVEIPASGNGEADAQPPISNDSTEKTISEEKTSLENRSVTKKTLEEIKNANANAAPSEIYKIGISDILFISLQNAPAKESTYFTVLKDGTIDYPLAGQMVSVAGLTTDEIEAVLQEKIKLYENPQISVKVREHNSHSYKVSGLADNPGDKFLKREAYPLLVVKSEAIVQSKADRAIIKRSNAETETIDLKDGKSDDILIYPGDAVEFSSADSSTEKQFYYIGGEIVSGGQKDFHKGITLTQAILASGGLKKPTTKRIILRRKNEAGMLSPISYDLKAIKEGKAPDPELRVDDTLEIVN